MQANDLMTTAEQISIIIIGAGLAGWNVVDAIRAKDKDVAITLITADAGDRYHKPMLSTAISQNKTRTQLIRTTGTDAANSADITLLTHTWVTAIDAKGHQLSLYTKKDGSEQSFTLAYAKLVIAIGATVAFPPNFINLDKDIRQNLWHVNHLDRFDALQTALNQGYQHIAVIGAGMVGTEIAEDLNNAGHQVSLIDIHPAPLSSLLPPIATARLAHALSQSGIELWMGKQVSDIIKVDNKTNTTGTSYQLTLTHFNKGITEALDTTETISLQVNHVIVSTGLKIDTKFITSAGLKHDPRTGIIVDEKTLQTNIDDIYAIGDCMSINGIACRYVAPLKMQAATIADDILGNEHTGYQHKSPMIRLKNKSISIIATGTPNGDGNWQTISDDADGLKIKQINDNGEVLATATVK